MSGIDPSFRREPQNSDAPRRADPSERTAAPSEARSDLEATRDSVLNEPWMEPGAPAASFAALVERNRAGTSRAGDVGVTLLVALAAGPAAVLCALFEGLPGAFGALYLVIAAPVVEELAKQAGSIWLLERRPWRISSAWQFLFTGAVTGLGFGLLENLIYFYVYGVSRDAWTWNLRWYGCTSLHVVCASIASLGLRKVWRTLVATGGPIDLAPAYRWFAAAMVLHAGWNTFAIVRAYASPGD